MMLPVGGDIGPPCTSCGQPRTHHPSTLVGRCLEYRQAPQDSVLACVLRCLRLDATSAQAQQWVERLRQAHIPLEVPAKRWYVDIARILAVHGVDVARAHDVGVLFSPTATSEACYKASPNGVCPHS